HAQGIDSLAYLKKVDSLIFGSVDQLNIQPLADPASNVLPKSQDASTNLSVDSSGQWLAFGLVTKSRKESFVHVWNVISGTAIWTERVSGVVGSIAISPDGKLVAASWDDQSVVIWDTAKKEPICTYHAGDTVRSLAFARDSSRLFAGTEGGKISIWSIPGQEVRTVLSGRKAYWVAFIDDDRLISTGGEIWETHSDRKVATIEPRAKSLYRWTISRHPGLVFGPSRNELIDVATGQAIVTLQDVSQAGGFNLGQVAFGNEDQMMAAAFGAGSIDLWDASTGELLRRFDVQPMAASVALSSDGKFLAAGTAWHSSAYMRGADNKLLAKDSTDSCKLTVWDTTTGRQVFHRTEKFAGGIWDLAFSPDGSYLAAAMGRYADTGTSSGRIRLWNSSNWRLAHELRGHTGSVWSVAFNAAGTRLVSSSGMWTKGFGQAKVWEVETGLELLTIADDNDPVFGIAISPDGHRLATANGNGLVRMWNGEPLMETPDYQELPLN
ncbi:MAG: WD40 repeat domain-containing protein, partial [Aureliella sp.]